LQREAVRGVKPSIHGGGERHAKRAWKKPKMKPNEP